MTEIRQKYGNKKCNSVVDGHEITFASGIERERYGYLLWLEKAGEISQIHLQPEYELQAAFTRNGHKYQREYYRADFCYVRADRFVVEDVKGKGVLTPLYKSKMKRFLAKYPDIEFVEVYKNSNGWIEREL